MWDPNKHFNPFERDKDGSIRSPTSITTIIKHDKELAKKLCREAGEPIERWFPENPR